MAKVPNSVEILAKIWTAWVGRRNVTDRQTDRQTDRRQTDGRATAYSERESEFTFAKKTTRPNFTKSSARLTCGRGLVSSDDNAICYVLSVLWMTSCFHMRTIYDALYKSPHHHHHHHHHHNRSSRDDAVCDVAKYSPWPCLRPDSVMEFGFNSPGGASKSRIPGGEVCCRRLPC